MKDLYGFLLLRLNLFNFLVGYNDKMVSIVLVSFEKSFCKITTCDI